MPRYDEEALERDFAKMTPEQRQKAQRALAKVEQLDSHPLAVEVHTAIQRAAEETGTGSDDIR